MQEASADAPPSPVPPDPAAGAVGFAGYEQSLGAQALSKGSVPREADAPEPDQSEVGQVTLLRRKRERGEVLTDEEAAVLRAYKTVNLPRELVDWIDHLLRSHRRRGGCGPLGIASRDEFVRVAVAVLGMALRNPALDQVPLERVWRLYVRWKHAVNEEAWDIESNVEANASDTYLCNRETCRK